MIAADLGLFLLLFIFMMILFLVFQVITLRFFKNHNLLYLSASAVLLSIIVVFVVSFFIVPGWFSTFNAYAVSIAGSGLAAIFASGLYTFLGPATADRSFTTHLFVLLYNEDRAASTKKEVMRRLNAQGLIEKRIDECKKEKLISESEGNISLTEKGKLITRFYLFILRGLRLRDRDGYIEYFRGE